MKKLSLLLISSMLLSSSLACASTYTLNKKIMDGSEVPFLHFSGPGEFDSYMTMNLPFAPASSLFQQIEKKEKLKLKNRGEAHITVITPVEYFHNLRLKKVSIKEIDQIAEAMKIQDSKFEVVCLGRGSRELKGQEEKTFYVVVKSEDLLNIRRKIQELYISKGGKAADFDPANFYPHITLGYTDRDLHESDGVIKGLNSCIEPIELVQ